jgi:hypothetical protein
MHYLRLADVYLVYAEAILGNNAHYIQMPRRCCTLIKCVQGAGLDAVTSLNADVIFKRKDGLS